MTTLPLRRFEDIDLAALPPVPDVVPADFETELTALRTEFSTRWSVIVAAYPSLPTIDALAIEGSPLATLMEAAAARLTAARQGYNDAVRAVLLASSWGVFLRHRGAEVGVVDVTGQSDDEFRRRVQLAPEAFSNAGPYGAYEWFAREAHPQVKVATAYGPESGLVTPGEVMIALVDRRGDGLADLQVIRAVEAALSPKSRRPGTEKAVRVLSASIAPCAISVRVTVLPGADRELIRQQIITRLSAFADRRHRPGGVMDPQDIRAASALFDSAGAPLFEKIDVLAPAGPVGGALTVAPYASAITVSVEAVRG